MVPWPPGGPSNRAHGLVQSQRAPGLRGGGQRTLRDELVAVQPLSAPGDVAGWDGMDIILKFDGTLYIYIIYIYIYLCVWWELT